MFKANLIQATRFFLLRRRLLIMGFGIILLYAIMVSLVQWRLGVSLVVILFWIMHFTVKRRIEKAIQEASTQQSIKLSDNEVILISNTDGQEKTIPLSEDIKIELLKKYIITNDYLLGIFQEMMGKPVSNYLVLEQNGQRQRFDFILDSDYSRRQLEKVIASWRDQGYTLVRV